MISSANTEPYFGSKDRNERGFLSPWSDPIGRFYILSRYSWPISEVTVNKLLARNFASGYLRRTGNPYYWTHSTSLIP